MGPRKTAYASRRRDWCTHPSALLHSDGNARTVLEELRQFRIVPCQTLHDRHHVQCDALVLSLRRIVWLADLPALCLRTPRSPIQMRSKLTQSLGGWIF